MVQESKVNGATLQGTALVVSGVVGAVTKSQVNLPAHMRGRTACQVGSAIGAAAANGAGITGSLGAGAAVLTAKVAAGTAVATAAAPFVVGAAVVGGIGYGLYKLFK